MNIETKVLIGTAVALALYCVAKASDGQEVRAREKATFGTEVVELRLSNAYDYADVEQAEERISYEVDPTERERLARILWDAGDPFMLDILAYAHEKRGDFVGAYAHAYALDRLAKAGAKRQPAQSVRGPIHQRFAGNVARLEKKLSPTQRAAGVKQAAQLIRNNVNCCTAI